MVTWTEEDLRNYERKRAYHNSHTQYAAPKLERHPSHAPLEKKEVQKGNTGVVLIRYLSIRKRLCDEDNLSSKWLTDCLRFVGAISGDEPDKVHIQTSQRKCQKGETESVIITIEPFTP